MSRRSHVVIICAAIVFLATGCVLTELRVTNHTGGQIQFYTGHTKKVRAISAGTTVIVPHTAGRIIIIAQNDEVWEYDMVDVPKHVEDVRSGIQKLILAVSIEPDGAILLPSGSRILPAKKREVKP